MVRTFVATLALAAAFGGWSGTASATDCPGNQGSCCYPVDTPVYKHTHCFDEVLKYVQH